MEKNNATRLMLWLIAAFLMAVSVTTPARAGVAPPIVPMPVTINPATFEVCPTFPGLAKKIVFCIRDTIIFATNQFMVPFAEYIATTVAAACVLAVLLWGVMITTGKLRAPSKDGFILMIKLGCVIMFTSTYGGTTYFAGLFPTVLGVMQWFIDVVTTYANFSTALVCPAAVDAWDRIDCCINFLLGGLLPATTVLSGIGGFIVACLVSNQIGIIIFMLGLVFIAIILMAIAQAVYTFIGAYVGVAFMVIVSPLFIPLILFKATKGYFEKWLHIFIGFILQPLFIFAYLAMLLAAFEVVVFVGPKSLYRTIAGNAVDNPGFQLGDYLIAMGIYGEKSQIAWTANVNPRAMMNQVGAMNVEDTGVAGVVGEQLIGNPLLWAQGQVTNFLGMAPGTFKIDMPTVAVDFQWMAFVRGMTYEQLIVNLLLSFLTALFVAYIFYKLLDALPFVGKGITEMLTMPTLGKGKLGPPGQETLGKFKDKLAENFGKIGGQLGSGRAAKTRGKG